MLKDDDILNIIGSELSVTNNQDENGLLSLSDSLAYYLGAPNGKEVEGRSHFTSTDVADAIEWIMPQIMKSFTQNNEVVIFDPVHEGDEDQAELESQYVYEVLMKQNDGFIILHQFVKDALMQRNGILKVYYAKTSKIKVSVYTGISKDILESVVSNDDIEILEQTEYIDDVSTLDKQNQIKMQLSQLSQTPPEQIDPAMVDQLKKELTIPVFIYDVKLSIKREKGQIFIDSVPREEFRVNENHNSINVDSARFTAHLTTKTVSEVLQDYDITKEQVEELPTSDSYNRSSYRFEQQGESYTENSEDDSQRLIDIAECYLDLDIDDTGIARRMKVDVAGADSPTKVLLKEEIDLSPWVTTTAFLMSHKFEGLSVTDRLKEIQDQKTTLVRNIFDNVYLQNNQRHKVVENSVNMDDLLISRPGGIVRVKRQDAVEPLLTPQLGADTYNMIDYLDRVRAGRTGVDPDGQAAPVAIGESVGSQGVERLMNAKEELVGLIVRVIAETGIKPLCIKIRDLTSQHVESIIDFRFRGVWYKLNPAEWNDRTSCTVRVGTGTGNHQLQIAALGQVLTLQEKIKSVPGQALTNEQKVFDTIDDFCKFSGLNGAIRYFIDPSSPTGKQARKQADQAAQAEKQKDDQIEQAMAQAQIKVAEAETTKANAQEANVKLRAQVESAKNELTNFKQTSDLQIQKLKQELAEAEAIGEAASKDADRALKKYEIDQKTAIELTRIEKGNQNPNKTDENQNFIGNQLDATA